MLAFFLFCSFYFCLQSYVPVYNITTTTTTTTLPAMFFKCLSKITSCSCSGVVPYYSSLLWVKLTLVTQTRPISTPWQAFGAGINREYIRGGGCSSQQGSATRHKTVHTNKCISTLTAICLPSDLPDPGPTHRSSISCNCPAENGFPRDLSKFRTTM